MRYAAAWDSQLELQERKESELTSGLNHSKSSLRFQTEDVAMRLLLALPCVSARFLALQGGGIRALATDAGLLAGLGPIDFEGVSSVQLGFLLRRSRFTRGVARVGLRRSSSTPSASPACCKVGLVAASACGRYEDLARGGL